MKKSKNQKTIKAFSLVETVVTLGIFGLLIGMLSQVLLLNLQVSQKISARTRIREELSIVTGLIQRDMRNADKVYISAGQCGNQLDLEFPANIESSENEESGCHIALQNQEALWVNGSHRNCDQGKLCKLDWTNQNSVLFETSDILTITDISFESQLLGELDSGNSNATLLVTLQAESTNPRWEILNQVRQISVTTRNF